LERSKYHKHIHKARSNPEKYLTIILDGMDQQKSAVPLLAKESKSVQGLWRLRTHITGAIVHTASPHGRKVYAYVDYLQWPHDSNLTINILEDILSKWSGSTLPEVLYLQLDNCCNTTSQSGYHGSMKQQLRNGNVFFSSHWKKAQENGDFPSSSQRSKHLNLRHSK
jgi:hypothetical protein